ncbi:MAG: Gfo/Idh/MocA family oxidoreductase, partial [Gemmatimonadaceae bacterium]
MTVSTRSDALVRADPPSTTESRPRGEPLRVAIVGFGKMGQHHARAIGHIPGARVVAIVDPSNGARASAREIVPQARVFSSLPELLESGIADVVHICTAPHTHEALATAAVAAGCHIYVEKPFGQSVAGVEPVLALARSNGVRICAGHQLLFEAPARDALTLLPALGELVHLESFFSFRTVRRSPDGRAPLRADLQLLDILPHPVYLLLEFLERAAPGETTRLASLDIGPAGTVHALVRRGSVTGTLVVTLEGRPVESYLRAIGRNGVVHADFVRGTVQRLIGPGTSGIDKALNPYRVAGQLVGGTTRALFRRIVGRQRSYPGLIEIMEAFYGAIARGEESPISPEGILETTRIWEQVAAAFAEWSRQAEAEQPRTAVAPGRARALVTGGTGFLGKEVVRALVSEGSGARVLARRTPPSWERVPGAEYVTGDAGAPLAPPLLQGVDVVVHCAAETAGGWEEHERNSVAATEHVLRAAAAAGVKRFIHVSSLAVLTSRDGGTALNEDAPLEPDARSRGPYVWGKL